jgi:hypothetical protein
VREVGADVDQRGFARGFAEGLCAMQS